jgi:filamentous hemagglutinin family protein
MSMVPATLRANPQGEVVVGGAAGFNRPDAATLIVNQNTDRAVINWNSFSIANGELTRFVQPSSSSAVLNRVVTANPSAIYGTLQANGNVYLINPGGVLVGAGGVVNTASFVASTHDINTEEFMKGGQLNFKGNSDASVINEGNITAREGDVFLIAKEVENEGQLMAKDGTVGMVSGTEVSLQAVGQGNYKVRLMAAETDPTSPRTSQGEGGSPSRKASESAAEIVNEGVIQAANAVLEAKGSYLPMAIKNTGVIEATGLLDNGDGSVTLTGGEGDILNTGVVAALQRSLDGQRETGGSIMMTAKNVTADPGSIITAAGKDGGGAVKLRSADTTILRGSIEVVGTSESAKGGKVQLLGEKVGMFEGAKVDASGGAGGGQVLVGGDYLGKNAEVPNAKAVVMAPTAEIRADAKISGDGGKVILWSDDYTGFFGRVTALGGPQGGNGGFVETSSAGNLQAMGAVNASASKGLAGEWLLDPGDITVNATGPTTTGGFSGGNPLVFTAPGAGSVVLNTDINSALNLGTSVTIQTGTGGEFGITVDAPIAKTLDNATTLTLDATGTIEINADITSIANELNMVFRADSDANNDGDFTLNAGADLLSNGGNITVTAADVILTGTMNTLKTIQIPVAVTAGGSYVAGVVPTVTIAAPASAGGIAATATSLMGLNTVAVGTGGTGYSSAPKVVIERGTGDTTGVGAAATAIVAGGVVTGITITNPGSGYTATPTITFVGGGGAGATAGAVLTQVVNLAFDGAGAPVSSPSYGVGYASGSAPLVSFGSGAAAVNLGGVANFAGDVLLKPSVAGTTIGVGTTPASAFNVSNGEIANITLNGSIIQGTLTIGDRTAGAITLGAGGAVAGGARNLSLVTGGTINDTTTAGVSTTGLLTLSAAGSIGSTSTLNISGGRVAVVTEGAILSLTSGTALSQLYVTTAGTTLTQNISDGGNLGYTVSENVAGDTTIAGLTVNVNSVDFLYENRSTLSGGGDITVTGAVLNVQAAAVGVPANFRNLELRAPNGTITVNSGISINSGGGNMTLASQDLDLLSGIGTADTFYTTTAGVLNTFQAVGGTYGTRVAGIVGSTGQISGTGGVLTLEPLSDSGAGRIVTISTGGTANTYNISRNETMLLEAPAIRIGGSQAADINIDAINPLSIRTLTYQRGSPLAAEAVTYLPRYFENPFFNATSPTGPDIGVDGVPHVEGGTVSFVSARGEVRNVPDGDVNVFGLSMTGLDGAYFDGRGGENTTYAAKDNDARSSGSVIFQISGRSGRTILDETIGNGGDYSFFRGGSYDVVDGRDVTGGLSSLTAPSGATATTGVTGGAVTSLVIASGGYDYSSAPVVTIYGGGIQEASARALVSSSGTVERVVPQIVGTGYTSAPLVTLSGGGGSGAIATAFVNAAGQLSPFEVTTPATYSFAPTIQIFGDGTGAVARPILSNGTSGTLTGIQIVTPGSGYTTVSAIVLSGGGQTTAGQAVVALAAGYNPSARGGQITPIYISDNGTGYTSEPTVTLSGGGIAVAQATAIIDTNLGSSTRGQVVGYQITDPGQGYTSAPSVIIGQGQAFGNFGEYGVSTEQVDQNRASGNIVLDSQGTVNNIVGNIDINAPVQTGNAFGVGGTSAVSGSILVNAGVDLTTNTDGGSDGVLITGDANVNGSTGGLEVASSGSITITAHAIANFDTSALAVQTGSSGMPIQIGTATGASGGNGVGSLSAFVTDRDTVNVGAGDLLIYAPAPGELETAAGQPIDPNHPQQPPRSSNDLFLSRLQSDATKTDAADEVSPDESLVVVEVGAFEGKLTLQRYAPSSATATIGTNLSGQSNGQVTLITPIQGGALYNEAPTVVITGGGIVQAEAGATSISGGQLSAIVVDNGGSGYGNPPTVTIDGGGGTGATAVATVANGVVTGITITDKGFGYTSLPTVTLSGPAGTPATATATSGLVDAGGATFVGGISSIAVDQAGTGYTTAPSVTITDSAGFGSGASATAIINSAGQVTGFTINSPGIFYIQPVVTLTNPAGLATATANLTNGQITSYTITSPGAGYGSSPTVFLQTSADPYNLNVDKLLLAADRFSILSGAPTSLVVTAATAVVAPYTNQRPINLGSATVGSTSFVSTDLQRFAVNDLVLGRRQETQPSVGAGVITISQAVAASSLRIANGIALAGTRQINDLGGSTGLAFKNVVLDAGAQVSLTGTENQIQYFSGIIRDSGIAENATFTLSSSLTSSGTSQLPLTIGEVFLDGAFGTGQRFYQGITTQNGDIRVFANQIQQTRLVGFLDTTGGGDYGSGGLGANTAQVTLAPLTAGTGINLYATTPSSSSVLGLRIGNPQALGLELVEAKGLVIGSGSLRDIQVTDGGFGYQAPPTVTISGGGGSGATGVSILSDTGYLVNGVTYYQVVGVRITNPGTGYTSAPTITVSGPAFGASIAQATATTGAAGAITINSNIEFNYLQYPNAPFQVTLASGSTGSITAQKINSSLGDIASNYYRVRVGALTLFDAGAVSLGGLNDVDVLSAILTGSGTASNLSFTDIDGIQLADLQIPGNLTITAGTVTAGAITQTTDGITVDGTASFATGAAAITLNNSLNSFGGAVTLFNTGASNVQITNSGALTLGTLTIGQNLTATSTGSLNFSGAATIGGTLEATSNGGAITQTGALTVSGASTIEAGAAAITLANAANNFVGTVTLSNSGSANAITLNDATGNLTIGNITSAGAVSITATGAGGTLLFNGTYNGATLTDGDLTGSLSATAESSGGSTALTISSAMANITSATLKTDGVFTLGAGADLGNSPGVPSATTTTSISLTSDSSLATSLGARITAQAITLAPYTDTLSLGLNDAAAGFNVPVSILTGAGGTQRIFARNTLTLGSATAVGGITIGRDGAVDLSSQTYGLVLNGLAGGVAFYNTLSLASGTGFDLSVGTSNVISETATDLVIGGTNGSVSFGSAYNVGSGSNSFTANIANIGTSALMGSLYYTSTYAGDLTVGQISVAGTSSFEIPTTRSFIAANGSNAFAGTVTLGSAGSIENVTINNSRALTLADLSITGDFSSTVTNGALTLGRTVVGNAAGDDFAATAVGINGGPLIVSGSTALAAGTGNIVLTGANDFGTGVSVVSSKNTSLYVPGDDLDVLGTTAANPSGTVVATETFDLRTDAGPLTLPTPTEGDSQLSSLQISQFQVGALSLTAASILMPYTFNFANISALHLASTAGSIVATGAISLSTLSLSSATFASLTASNQILNLGTATTSGGNFTFVNARGLNLAGTVSVVGTADLTVAGQFYNTSGQALPFARTTGRAVVRSLSMMGGLPKKISALAGFKNSYNFTDPGTSRAMIYAVSPLAQFAPSGTTIAGVDLSGTQTGGGQFNTFLTGSDNLNWMISDFGRFEMPTVKPSGLDYILYPQRVEPETRTLPAATLGQLERELGRPPTLDEIQAREVAVREAAMVRSGAILERTSFDAIEDEVDKQESAEVPAQVIDGGKPQADARGQRSEDGMKKAEIGKRDSEGFGPQARKTHSVKQGANGPILRSGPIRSVAELRPAEPAEGASAGKTATQAVHLDAKSVIEQERASAEVGIAPPIAAGR